MYLIGTIGLVVMVILAWRSATRRQSERNGQRIYERLEAARVVIQQENLDLGFAAQGYVQVTITRRYAPDIDLHTLERGFAEKLSAEGCTKAQALSARWGGVCAISDDLEAFDDALAIFKETADSFGHEKSLEATRRANQAAALAILTLKNHVQPLEYPRFLRYIGA